MHNPLRSKPFVIIPDRPTPTKAQKAAAWSRWGNLTDVELFQKHVEPDTNGGCWLWSGTGGRYGNAFDRPSGRPKLAHRVAWRIYRGPIEDGLAVCHKCDVTRCVNPDHLFLGTPTENMADMRRKGRDRHPAGSSAPNVKLSERDVLEIARRLRAGETHAAIGAIYRVTKEAISAIRRGVNWRSITGGPIT